MKKFNEEHMNINEYIEYLEKETGILTNSSWYITQRLKSIYEKESIPQNIILDKDTMYLSKRWVNESIELFKQSISVYEVIKIIKKYKYIRIQYINRNVIEKKCKVYKIPLIDSRNSYIDMSDLNRIIVGLKEVDRKECINQNDLLSKMEKLFVGLNFREQSKPIFKYIRDNSLEVIKKDYIGNFITPIRNLYPKTTVEEVIKHIKILCEKGLVKLENMSFEEYYSLSKEEFDEEFRIVTLYDLMKSNKVDCYINKADKLLDIFTQTTVKCIYINLKGMYVHIKGFNEFLESKKNYLKVNNLNQDINIVDYLKIKNNDKEKLRLKEKRIIKYNEEYILIKEYIVYFHKETGIGLDLGRCNPKFKKMYKENIEGQNVIMENNIIYLRKKWVIESVELYKLSISVSDAIKVIEKNKYMKIDYVDRSSIENRCKVFTIPIIHNTYKYIFRENLNLILEAIEEIYTKECINGNELLYAVNSMFKGITFGATSKLIFKFIRDNKLEVIKRDYIGNLKTPILDLYPKATVDKVIENVRTRCEDYVIKLINLTFEEYYNLSAEEFNKEYKELTPSEFNEISGYKDINTKFRNCKRIFNDTKVKCIWIHQRAIYVSKKEYKEFLEFKNNYVNINQLEERGINIKGFIKIIKNNNFDIIYYKQKYYINNNDVPRFIGIRNKLSDLESSNTIYDKFMVKIKYYECEKKDKFSSFNSLYKSFIRLISKNNNILNINSKFFSTYVLLLDCLEKDLVLDNKDYNNKMFKKALLMSGNSINNRNGVIQFSNYLIKNKGFEINKLTDIKEKTPLSVYEQEEFINLLIKLIDIIGDKESIKKLYRNWNLSSSITYVFMHYSLAWRKNDLANKLSVPILERIDGVTDGESFIKWLEEGNEITDRMAYDICKDLENMTRRLNLKASKNNQELSCVISSSLSKEVATLLCICEANRQIHSKNIRKIKSDTGLFNPMYLEPKQIQKIINDNYNVNINEILSGGFSNIRMNKSFLTLVKEKAEELGMAYAYYYAQVSRGHKAKSEQLAETTKIYLKRDIEKASLMAFSMGTMGSVVHTILQLVSRDYKDNDVLEQIQLNNSLGLTAYTLERNVKKISNKIISLDREIDRYFKSGGEEKSLLKELFFGQDCYGINERTKCLIKITRKDKGSISRIKSLNYNKISNRIIECPMGRESCIGCDYMIALRYFIYEFEKRFNTILDELDNCSYDLDKKIIIYSINHNYIPILNDLEIVLGDEVRSVIDIERFIKLVEKYGG